MNGKFFWLVLLVIFAIVGHLAYVLFVPGYKMEQKMALVETAVTRPGFQVIDGDANRNLFPGDDPALVNAVCAFDMKLHTVKITTPIISGYWSLSVYSQKGDSYYSINDRQTLGASLQISIHAHSDDSEADLAEITSQLEQNKVKLTAASPEGWVVLRMLASNAASRGLVRKRAATLFKCEKSAISDVQ